MAAKAIFSKSLILGGLLAAGLAPASAGEWRDHGGFGGNGLPSVTPWGDTYAGSLSALNLRRNGTYVYLDRHGAAPPAAAKMPRQEPRIITVGTGDGCSYEAGVCVIRP